MGLQRPRREGQTTHYGLRKILRCAATKTTLFTLQRSELSGQCGGVEEGGEGLQSRPTSPAPITQADKKKFFCGASPLNAQRSSDFGHKNGIIYCRNYYLQKFYQAVTS